MPGEVTARLRALSLADVIDVALGNNPQTRISWAQSRAAAAVYASSRGRWLPTLQADASGGPARAISSNPARVPADRTTVTTTVSLQYLLFDFGARGGVMGAAHEALFAADLTHNGTVQAVVLQAEGAYFNYQASRGLFAASLQSVKTAQTNLAAAERRHDVGLATIADVLQARTALAQSQLSSQNAEGTMQGARAQLALALGVAANTRFDVVSDTGATPLAVLAEFGGFEMAMMVGAMLGAAEAKMTVLIDGFIVGSAALTAIKLFPALADYCVFCHRSAEAGHSAQLEALNAEPLLDLGLRLGEGTGAALAYPLVLASLSFLNEMASFASAGVAEKT